MARPLTPFVLLDDARSEGASPARLYTAPHEIVVAHRAEAVAPALERLAALSAAGAELAGYLSYEAGLALEPRLAPLAAARTGSAGPLLWFGAFAAAETIEPDAVAERLATIAAPGPAALGPLEPALSPGGYGAAFAAMRGAIAAGDIYQANLTFPLAGSYRGDPVAIYAALRGAGGAGYGALVCDGSHYLLSCSPELFFAARGGELRARPMKGTRPRGRTADEDAALRADLAASDKDHAENRMIVDLLRNDLSRVAVPGSVVVADPFAIERYPTVHQMVTTVRARIVPGAGIAEMLRALFPCGSITGAPKIRAMELIAGHERDPRGPYCGAIGRISPPPAADGDGGGNRGDGAAEAAFNVAIRTLRLTPVENGQGRAVLGVGSAIVADSHWLPEWRECLVKAGFARTGVSGADLIETMHFAPERGIALLEGHLARLKASAAALGFAFDRHAVRNAIQALCFEASEAGAVRLSVARSGAYTLEIAPLPAPLPAPARCGLLPLPVDPGDWRLAHKTSDRGFYEAGLATARAAGADEALFVRDDGLLTEGCFTNLFVRRGERLLTPRSGLGLLPGVLRQTLIEAGEAAEAELTVADLADGFLIGNALRGLMPAELLQ